jgi:hypothetical protein
MLLQYHCDDHVLTYVASEMSLNLLYPRDEKDVTATKKDYELRE